MIEGFSESESSAILAWVSVGKERIIILLLDADGHV